MDSSAISPAARRPIEMKAILGGVRYEESQPDRNRPYGRRRRHIAIALCGSDRVGRRRASIEVCKSPHNSHSESEPGAAVYSASWQRSADDGYTWDIGRCDIAYL
jgi:hypothetical protein